MLTEVLNVSVVYGNGSANPMVPEIFDKIPRVKLLCQAQGPRDLEVQYQGVPSDCVLVYLDGEQTLPDWLTDLTTSFPQAAIMLCSARMEPEFLIRAMQMGVREIPLPLNAQRWKQPLNGFGRPGAASPTPRKARVKSWW